MIFFCNFFVILVISSDFFVWFFSNFSVICDFWCFLDVIFLWFCDFSMWLFCDFKGGVRKKISELPLGYCGDDTLRSTSICNLNVRAVLLWSQDPFYCYFTSARRECHYFLEHLLHWYHKLVTYVGCLVVVYSDRGNSELHCEKQFLWNCQQISRP